jgi:hypothetical protein
VDAHQDNWRVGNWQVSSNAPFATPNAGNSVAAVLPPFQPLWLNEVEAQNLTGITNRAGQRTPWLELYNPTTNSVSLNGLYLANNYTNLLQWAFPGSAVIKAGQFEVIFADGQTNLSTTNELHTAFVLPVGDGSVALTRVVSNAPQVLDYVNYSGLPADDSYGSFPNGQSFVREIFYQPTPGAPNNASGVPPPSYILYDSPGQIYAQDFDSLPDPGATSVNSDDPVTINDVTYSLANPFDFAFPSAATGNGGLGLSALAGWYGHAALTPKFGATDGDQTTGGVLDFGPADGSNRALGLLATSTTGGTAFGARLINITGTNLDFVTLNFTGEVWRQSNTSKTLQFFYFVDPTATNLWPTAVTAFLPDLNVAFPTVSGDSGGAAVDGTAAINQTNLGVVNQVITNWPPGAALWLVWEMTDNTGKAQGLAIDNLNFSAAAFPSGFSAPELNLQPSSGTTLMFTCSTVAGLMYQLEYNNNLNSPNWVPVGSPVPGTGTPATFNIGLTNTQSYFRLQIVN